ncbi:MAG: hypothetical protein NC311_15755 [Muribaculaceae bacterium]|nr:hypothetical protein [Muribaculaceae bacterium]
MSNFIYGKANLINFTVSDHFIKWESYTIAIDSISVFSTGVSTQYVKKSKEKGGFGKALDVITSMFITFAEIADEDANTAETLNAALKFCGGEDLPCINLVLSGGITMEITFTDLMSYCESVKSVRNAFEKNAKQKGLEVHAEEFVLNEAEFNGETLFLTEEITDMQIGNQIFHAPATVNNIENHYASETAQLREAAGSQSAGNRELADALERLADAVEKGNEEAARKNASAIMKDVGSGTLTSVLSNSVLALIKHFAG